MRLAAATYLCNINFIMYYFLITFQPVWVINYYPYNYNKF